MLFSAGCVIFLTPVATNYINTASFKVESVEYVMNNERLEEIEVDKRFEYIDAYNQRIEVVGMNLHDPWGKNTELADEQLSFIDPEAVFATITIPAIDVDLPIYLGASMDNLEYGAALVGGTSLPVGGTNTNAVIAGHRSMPTADMFRYIDELASGDEIFINVFNTSLKYEVSGSEVVEPTAMDSIQVREGKDMITLLTCTPYGTADQRLLVYAERAGATMPVTVDNLALERNVYVTTGMDALRNNSKIWISGSLGLLFSLLLLWNLKGRR